LTLAGTGGYLAPVPGHLPLLSQRLVVVTGKGGVGKSAVTAALARAAVGAGRRVLAVEVGQARLGPLLEAPAPLGTDPVRLGPKLSAASIDPEEALGDFVQGVLRLRVFARRLLESTSFQVLAAAAPGLAEFLVLHKIGGWLDARRLGRTTWDLVVVDAPASGHSLPLLDAPRTLGALARIGPVGETLAALDRRLHDPAETLVVVVTTPEELAVRETIELYRELDGRLGLPVAPPVVNAMPARRFGAADEARLSAADVAAVGHPHLAAARFEITRRAQAAAQVRALRTEVGRPVVRLPFLYEGPEAPGGVARLAAELAQAAGLAA
jgi:anion-transporting  ArsA/GET3 family ATPase